MVEIDGKCAELLALPIRRGIVAEARGVNDRHDGHLHLRVREIDTADASVVLSGCAQVVLV